jgi:two-component system, NarL family, captular synthesis response regulator RcsB
MFQKVLIVDDIDFNDIAAAQALRDLGVLQIDCAKYCDEALLKIKNADRENNPYQLLISDLSFKEDHRTESLKSGEALVAKVRELFPAMKVIVFSIEDKSYRIKSLFEKFDIAGYVIKGRNSMTQLKKAVQIIFDTKEKFLSPELNYILQDKTIQEIDNYDIELIKQLSYGIPQESMDAKFLELGIKPNSKSTIEKRISKLKIYFKASNPAPLVSIAKDLGLI